MKLKIVLCELEKNKIGYSVYLNFNNSKYNTSLDIRYSKAYGSFYVHFDGYKATACELKELLRIIEDLNGQHKK